MSIGMPDSVRSDLCDVSVGTTLSISDEGGTVGWSQQGSRMTEPKDLHQVIRALEAKLEIVARERNESAATIDALVKEQTKTFVELTELRRRLEHFDGLKGAGRLIELDFPVTPKVRFGWGDRPVHTRLAAVLQKGRARYGNTLRQFGTFSDALAKIESKAPNDEDPHWINDWIPALDGISLYGYAATRNPRLYLEIGSGTSTKFVRRAIRDHGLRTKIVSIDPFPRSEVDRLCDEVVRSRLEDADLTPFFDLTSDDMLFFDGSHRALQNSDVTAFFLDILPELKPGVLVGVHDIFLPHDYPVDWLERFYSEQYLLACWLLAGERLKVELPVFYCVRDPELVDTLRQLRSAPNLVGANWSGGIFWFSPR
jgi:hypothetical protein